MGTKSIEHWICEYAAPGIVVTCEALRCQLSSNGVRRVPQVVHADSRAWMDLAVTDASVKDHVTTVDQCPKCAWVPHRRRPTTTRSPGLTRPIPRPHENPSQRVPSEAPEVPI